MGKSKGLSMTKGPMAGPMLRLAVPLALTGMLQQFLNTTDTFVVGRFVSTEALAALGNNGPLVGLLVSLFMGLSLGANVVIAKALGGRRIADASSAIHTSFFLAVFWGLGIAAAGEAAASWALRSLGVPEAVFPEAELYLRIYLLGLPGIALYNFASAIYRSKGNAKTPLYALGAAGFLNVIMDLGAVYFGMGLFGVVCATTAANYLSAALLFLALRSEHGALRVYPGAIRWHGAFGKEILRIGIPAGVQGMVFCLSNVIIQSAINSLGAEVMAASAAGLVLELNTYCFLFAFGQTMTTFVSQNYGAGNLRRCRDISRKGLMIFCCLNLLISAASCLLSGLFLSLFGLSGETIAVGQTRIYTVVGFYVLCGAIDLISGILRGYGLSLPPALLMLFTICGVRVLWVYTAFAADPAFLTVMYSYPLSWAVTLLCLIPLYFYYRRRLGLHRA